ncbi:MAG: hypothetical protein ABI895_09615 [Deltaproteobacteria bacterium]
MFAAVAQAPVSIVDMDAQGIFLRIALFVCAVIVFKALLEAVIRLRLLQLGQSARHG